MRKQLAAVGLVGGLAIGAAAGFAFTGGSSLVGAQDETTTTTAPRQDDGRPAPGERLRETLQSLVDDGTITDAQADKVVETLVAARPDGGRHGHHGPKGGFGLRGGAGLDAAAEALGLSADDLREELRGGRSLAEIAESKDVDVAKVVDALVAEATNGIDEAVDAGRLTQEEADERIDGLRERIAAMVDGERPDGDHFGGYGGSRDHHRR